MNANPKVNENDDRRFGRMARVIGRCLAILTLSFATTLAAAQEPASRPNGEPPRREGMRRQNGRRERAPLAPERAEYLTRLVADVEKRETSWDKRRLGAFARMAEDFLRSMTPDEFKAAAAKAPASVQAEVFAAADLRRKQKDDKFLDTLPAEEAARIRSLSNDERRKKIDDLRVNQQLEIALKNAMAQGVIDEDEADGLRKGDTQTRIESIAKLSKRVFLHVHAQDLSPQTKQRLENLEPSRFFRDPFVERHRLIDALRGDDIEKLMKLPPEERQKALAALAAEPMDVQSLANWFSKEAVARVGELSGDDRRRLIFELSRVHGAKYRFMLPPELMRQLNDDDRQKLTGMDATEAVAYLRQRFPDLDWKELEPRLRLRARFEEMISGLSAGDREKLWRMTAEQRDAFFLERFGDKQETKDVLAMIKAEFGARQRRPFLPPELAKELTPEETKKLEAMEPKDAMVFLVERFPDTYRERLDRVARFMRLTLPESWATMKTPEKVGFLFSNSQSPGELMRLFTFVRGMRRGGERGDREGPDHERGERGFGPPRRPESRPSDGRSPESRPARH